MGQELFAHDRVFRYWMTRLDDMVHDLSGQSVLAALYSPKHRKSDAFERTLLTHPAIFMVEYSLAQALIHENVLPDLTLGASLGSFAAATVAGLLDVEDALRAVVRQAALLEECCEPGGMIAALADPALYAEEFLCQRSELAAVNFAAHFVVSSQRSQLAEIEAGLNERKLTYQRLPVAFAFHSRWIDEARAPFVAFLRSMRHKRGTLPMVCCDRAAVLDAVPDDYFWSIARNAIRFPAAIARLEEQGPYRYIDLGPAGTLATFMKYGLLGASRSTTHVVLTPFGLDQRNMAALCAAWRH